MPARYKYHKITPDELSRDLDRLNLSASQLARTAGAQRRNVLKWLGQHRESLEIPHHINLLLMTWKTFPETLTYARMVADNHVIEEEDDEEVEA